MKLLIATTNPKKLRELQRLFANLPFELVSLPEVGITQDVEETGTTFKANAALKAHAYQQLSGLLTLADDSGLAVDALGGQPGVYSARFFPGSDEDRYTHLLGLLKDVPDAERTARFVSVICLVAPDGQRQWFCEGVAEGLITRTPRGSFDFGYDPVFEVPALGQTYAEIAPEEKAVISHRARAAFKAAEVLDELACEYGLT